MTNSDTCDGCGRPYVGGECLSCDGDGNPWDGHAALIALSEVTFMAADYGDMDGAQAAAQQHADTHCAGRDWTLHTIFEHHYMGPGRIGVGYELEVED
jgi:hypothetical protein